MIGPCVYCGMECIEPHEFRCEDCGEFECCCPIEPETEDEDE